MRKKTLFNANVFIDLVQSVPQKPTLSMTGLLNSSWKNPPRSRDRDLKKVPKITSTPTMENRAERAENYILQSKQVWFYSLNCKKSLS